MSVGQYWKYRFNIFASEFWSRQTDHRDRIQFIQIEHFIDLVIIFIFHQFVGYLFRFLSNIFKLQYCRQ